MKREKIKRIWTQEDKEKFRQTYIRISLTIFFVALFLIAFNLGNGYLYIYDVGYVSELNGNDFQFHVIDVGQGDCFLIKLPDNKTLLIDCGEADTYEQVSGYIKKFLKEEKLSKIDYFVLTHQDEDHIGNASQIIKRFDVGKVFRPKVYSKYEQENSLNAYVYGICETDSFNEFTIALHDKGVDYTFNEKGVVLAGENYSINFLSPSKNSYSNSNDYSAVIMLKIYQKKFLLMGDASYKIENELIEEYGDYLKADVLKISHHGSKSSSSQDFLDIVKPKYAILTAEKDSDDLPNVDVLNRFHAIETTIYSTKKLGCYAFTTSNNEIIMKSHPVASKDIPLIASLIIIAICMVWGLNFERKQP